MTATNFEAAAAGPIAHRKVAGAALRRRAAYPVAEVELPRLRPGREPDELELRGVPALPHGKTAAVDIHCVTRWSKFDNVFEGIPYMEIHKRVKPKPEAKFVHGARRPGLHHQRADSGPARAQRMFAYKNNGEDITDEHGWPMRLVVPHLYFWKSAKWVRGLEYLAEDEPGFWEDAATTCAATRGKKKGIDTIGKTQNVRRET